MTPNEEILFLKVTVTLLSLVLLLAVVGLLHLRSLLEQTQKQLKQQHQKPTQQPMKK